jgi:hypothetical protein
LTAIFTALSDILVLIAEERIKFSGGEELMKISDII